METRIVINNIANHDQETEWAKYCYRKIEIGEAETFDLDKVTVTFYKTGAIYISDNYTDISLNEDQVKFLQEILNKHV
jgi:hypothetical protein